MRTGDIIGLVLLLAVVGLGGYYLMKKNASAPPAGSAPPVVPANTQQPATAPPQPTPQSAVLTGDQLLAQTGIQAGRDVLLGAVKGIFG